MSSTEAIAYEQIDQRNAGCAAEIDGKLYIWGGEGVDTVTKSVEVSDSDSESEDSTPKVVQVTKTEPVFLPRKGSPKFDVCDLTTRTWTRQLTLGDIPDLGNGSTLTYHPGTHAMYLFAGLINRIFSSQIYKISVATWVWEKITLASSDEPSPRYLTGVVLHNDRLCVFAGVSPPPDLSKTFDVGSSYHAYEVNGHRHNFGWNNEYFEFIINECKWKAVLSGRKAGRPPPTGGHVFTKFDSHRALYVGGRRSEGRADCYYIFDLEDKKFSPALKPTTQGCPLPTARTFATLSPLVNPQQLLEEPNAGQRLLLLWGKHDDHVICNEAWEIDIETRNWKQVNVGTKRPRAWHIACALYSTPGECQIVVFGGNSHVTGESGVRENVSDLRILSFGVQSLQVLSLSAIVRAISGGIASVAEVKNRLPESYPLMLQKKICEAFSAHQCCGVERITE